MLKKMLIWVVITTFITTTTFPTHAITLIPKQKSKILTEAEMSMIVGTGKDDDDDDDDDVGYQRKYSRSSSLYILHPNYDSNDDFARAADNLISEANSWKWTIAYALGGPGQVTSRFKEPREKGGQWYFHTGVDLRASIGTPIYATTDGYIRYQGWMGGYGKTIFLVKNVYQNGNPWDSSGGTLLGKLTTIYAHLNDFAGSPGLNQWVRWY
jgi:murein DD-endopeptidase MepM/ murein hydrolase activator NlpD